MKTSLVLNSVENLIYLQATLGKWSTARIQWETWSTFEFSLMPNSLKQYKEASKNRLRKYSMLITLIELLFHKLILNFLPMLSDFERKKDPNIGTGEDRINIHFSPLHLEIPTPLFKFRQKEICQLLSRVLISKDDYSFTILGHPFLHDKYSLSVWILFSEFPPKHIFLKQIW